MKKKEIDLKVKEATEKMKSLQNDGDIEGAHWEADLILMKILQTLGYKELVEEYNKIQKWYA